MSEPFKDIIQVGIIGGGIASLCLAHALCRQPHLNVNIFEASATIRDEGAAVGLGSNAQAALALISPMLRDALDEAGGTTMKPSVRIMMGTGPDAGRLVGDINPAIPQIVVHRGTFLRALLRRVPEGVVKWGKKLVSIQSFHNHTNVVFDDGSTFTADVLIGCDGINSTVRKAILGKNHPAAEPQYTWGYVHRVVVPIERAIPAFGAEYCGIRTQHGWVGDGGFLLTDLNTNATSMQVIAGWQDEKPWPHDSPFVPWPKERLKEDLNAWGEIGKAMYKIFTEEPQLYAGAGRTHPETPTYFKDHMCIVGDAAQSFSPFQGAGVGQAIEDALILQVTLGCCDSKSDVKRALQTYDVIRRPRRSDVAASSDWAAKLLTGADPEAGMNVDGIAAKIKNWCSNIYDYDLAGSKREAQARMVASD